MGLTVTFVQNDGVEKVVTDAQPGDTLMFLGRSHCVEGILGDCGGGCSCATCHVYVDETWLNKMKPPDDIEAGMLDMVADIRSNSRLGCQIKMTPELDGIKVTVAPNL
jgi:ferredoxin, 2Fe-2S